MPAPVRTALDDYVGTLSPNFTWFDTGVTVEPLLPLLGGRAHMLNVTSQQWLTEREAIGPTGSLWTHQVAVIVPHNLKYPQTAAAYLTGGCNEGPPKPPSDTDEDLLVAAQLAESAGVIAIIVYQLPNCHLVYPSDPSGKRRSEDEMIAWAWRQYLVEPSHDPRWLPRFPMVKAAFACMRAAAEWANASAIADIGGWMVAGASKRGWTTWMAGATAPLCSWCPKVVGLAPLVPIVPYLHHSVHLQRRSLGGFTFAFSDYFDAGVLDYFDTDEMKSLLQLVDPANYLERFRDTPTLAIVSSDDEFMQLDWTGRWVGFPGESKLLVAPNSEHSLATGIPEVLGTLGAFFGSIAAGQTSEQRPAFSFSRDNATGALTVTPTRGPPPDAVVLRHAHTLGPSGRRDFRWVRKANASSSPCNLPDVPMQKPLLGGNCLQPILWHKTTLAPAADGSYSVTPPAPDKAGHFTGYYVELLYAKHAVGGAGRLQISTPGYVWPDTLPFADCELKPGVADECPGRLV